MTTSAWRNVRVDWIMRESRETVSPEQMAGREVFHYSIPALAEHNDGILEDGNSIASSKPRVGGGELLVSKLNPRKSHVILARRPAQLTVCSGEFIVLRPVNCDPQFMYYFFLSERARQNLNGAVQSVTKSHQRASPSAITKMWLKLPPPEEQRVIAEFLDRETTRIDNLIEKNRAVAARLKERWDARVSRVYEERRWPRYRLKHLLSRPLEYGVGEAAEYEDVSWPRYVRTTDVTPDGRLRAETFRSLPPQVAGPYMLEEGDLLLTRSGATVGKAFMYRPEWGPACFAGYLIRAHADRTKVLPDYLRFFTESASYWQQVQLHTLQATIQNVSAERYGEFGLPIPPLERQRAVVSDLHRREELLRRLFRLLDRQQGRLRERRQALITAAVTGHLETPKAA